MPSLVVLGVRVDENPEAYRQFLARHEVDYLTIRDPQQHSNALYGTFASLTPTRSTAMGRFAANSSMLRTGPRRRFSISFLVSVHRNRLAMMVL